MLLRDHPLKSPYGVSNWPPVGTWLAKLENSRPNGEIRVLKSLISSRIQPVRFFLCIDYEDSS
jgi:hypothetical protein